jgi:hypothetical protein
MATNLERHGDRLRWRFDLAALEALLRDFFRTDLWQAIEQPAPGLELHIVKASESSILDGETLARVERASAASDQVVLHELEGGHWLNADNPEGLVGLLAEGLAEG